MIPDPTTHNAASPPAAATVAPIPSPRHNPFRTLFALYLPLALSFELMMLEGPAVQGAMGRLPGPALHLAAWGLTMSLSLLIESPVILLLATAIALVRDAASFHALHLFMVRLALGCTLLTGLVAFTPVFDALAGRVMGQPPAIVAQARPAMQIMLLWTAAIAWRRFYQGVLVRYGHTRWVTWGTLLRLVAAVGVATGLAHAHRLPGAQVAAWAIMAAVVTEAVATSLFARSVVKRHVLSAAPNNPDEPPLSQRAIWRFHAPLALTTLLTLLAQPLTSAALARLPRPGDTLAAWPVVFLILLVIRGWGLAVQEITVAQEKSGQTPEPVLRRFALLVGCVTGGFALLVPFTPLLDWYLGRVIELPAPLWPLVRAGVLAGGLLPFVTALGSWARGRLVARGDTGDVYRGMAVNLSCHIGLLALGVWLNLPGMATAALAFTLAATAEYVYLVRRRRPVPAAETGEAAWARVRA